MDFKKLQDTATISKEALANKTSETAQALEQSFVDAMTSWETAVKATEDEAKTNTTKSNEALQVRSDFDTFKNNKETEIAGLLIQEQAENKEVETEIKNETIDLLNNITEDSIAVISAAKDLYKDKTRADMIQMDNLPTYINAFQTIIIQLGASTGLDDTSIDRIGPITRVGIKTIQQYLNDTYQGGLDIDGVPGPKTLEALFTLIGGEGADKDMTRLDKMLSEKPTLHPFPVEVIPTKRTYEKKPKTERNSPSTAKAPDIKGTNEEISETMINNKFQELKKLRPTFDIAFLKAWAMGILNLKEPATTGEFEYNNKIYYFENSKTIRVSGSKAKFERKTKTTAEAAKIKVDKNINENTTVDKDIILINQERIESGLDTYMKKNLISFQEEPNKTLCEKYYRKNIINLKNVKIITSQPPNGTTRINFRENGTDTRYYIELTAKDFIKKEENNINYETINTAIKNDIISKVNKEKEQQEVTKLKKRYGELKDYLEGTYFSINTLYTPQEQKTTFIQAFFKDFPNGVEFNRGDSTFDENNKKIKFEFENRGSNKYGYGIMDINNKFKEDGTLNKIAINKGIKSIIDIIIKRTYPEYVAGNNYNELKQ